MKEGPILTSTLVAPFLARSAVCLEDAGVADVVREVVVESEELGSRVIATD
jgi:hypothetical protein